MDLYELTSTYPGFIEFRLSRAVLWDFVSKEKKIKTKRFIPFIYLLQVAGCVEGLQPCGVVLRRGHDMEAFRTVWSFCELGSNHALRRDPYQLGQQLWTLSWL